MPEAAAVAVPKRCKGVDQRVAGVKGAAVAVEQQQEDDPDDDDGDPNWDPDGLVLYKAVFWILVAIFFVWGTLSCLSGDPPPPSPRKK